jgi:hypothetical protein
MGNMEEIINNTSTFIATILSVVTGALLAHHFGNLKDKSALSIATFNKLFDEIYSENMLKYRRKADKFLLENPTLTFKEAIGYKHEEFSFAFSTVLHTFQRIASSYKSGIIPRKLAMDCLKPLFSYWYKTHILRFKDDIRKQEELVWIFYLAEEWDV